MTFISNGQPNVFEMYAAHGGPGFWLRRTTWDGTCARVVRVGELTGPPPYYGNPSVIVDVYSLDGTLKDGAVQLPVPGTYKTWRKIDDPDWASPESLRRLDDPCLADALLKLDRKRNKLPTIVAERTFLTVPFPRKDEAKKIGAKWDPTRRIWWIQTDDAEARARAVKLGFLADGCSGK